MERLHNTGGRMDTLDSMVSGWEDGRFGTWIGGTDDIPGWVGGTEGIPGWEYGRILVKGRLQKICSLWTRPIPQKLGEKTIKIENFRNKNLSAINNSFQD